MSEDQSTVWIGNALPLGKRHRAMMREVKPVVCGWIFSAIAVLAIVGITVTAAQISIELKAIERATHAGDPD